MNKVNMSLDDIIKKNKHSKRNSNVARRGRGNGFRKNDGQTRQRKRFDQVDDGRKPSFGNNRGSIRNRGGYRRYNNFNKNEFSNGRGAKVGI